MATGTHHRTTAPSRSPHREKRASRDPVLPRHNGDVNGARHARTKRQHRGIRPEGESGRRGFHPLQFFVICFRSASKVSAAVNILWPVVPAAIACYFALSQTPEHHLIVFILCYIGMVPCANLVGFAGQELSRKVPHTYGVLIETTFGSVVELILFGILLSKNLFQVIQAAILGSILATLLLCLGLCFIAGGIHKHEQTFNAAVSEAGSGLMLTAAFGLAIPTIFHRAFAGGQMTEDELTQKALNISRITAILLIIAFAVYVFYQARTHTGIYDNIFEQDELADRDRGKDLAKPKLTLTECIVALAISIGLVTLIAYALVDQIEHIVHDRHISDAFMGLILVPLVEKAAEHLTAVDEAYDGQMNFALAHVLGATLQTALLNGPLIVVIGWGLHRDMALEFELFDIAMLVLAVLTVGNFLRDLKTNYLEGFLCVIIYIAIAVAAYNNDTMPIAAKDSGSSGGGH